MAKFQYLLVGVIIGVAITSISTGIFYSMRIIDVQRISSFIEKREQQPVFDPTLHHNQKGIQFNKTKKRMLQAIFGSSFFPIFSRMQDLATKRPYLRKAIETWEEDTMILARYILEHFMTSENLNFDAAFRIFSEEEGTPSVTLTSATYGPLPGIPTNHRTPSTVDVLWIMERFIFDSLLRIPTNYSVLNLFGTQPLGKDEYFPFILNVEGILENGTHVHVSVPVLNGTVQEDLIISSALPTQHIIVEESILRTYLLNVTTGKIGLELGGPTAHLFAELYKQAYRTDLVNFSEETIWGTFKNGSMFNYTKEPDGGWGTMHITDGATLHGIADNTYDFVLGSHYLEHLINPLQAMAAMARVTKPGGYMILVLPKKEACFDHYRGQSPIEDILFRYLHMISPTDMRYSNIDHWMFGNDLLRDYGGNFHQMLARSVRFPENRAIHIHVYDYKLLESLGKLFSFEIAFKTVKGALNQFIFFKKPLN